MIQLICTNCKTKNKIRDKYCENCGEKLQWVFPKISKKVKIIVGVILVVLLIGCSGYWIGNYFTSPAYLAKQYFKCVTNNDVSKIYQYMNVNDSTFVSEKLLQEKVELLESVDTYRVIDVEEKGREATVLLEYYLENDSKTYHAYVNLYRNHGKKWLFYPNWKIDSAKLAENIVFQIPTGATITVDEIDLTPFQNIEQSKNGYDIYQISKMIAGTYQVKVTLPIGTVIEKKLTIEDGEQFTVGEFELSNETQEQMENAILQSLQTFYTGATQNQSFDTIRESLPSMKISAQIQKRYRNLKSSLQSEDVTFTQIKVTSVELLSTYYNKNGKLTTTIEIVHDDSYTYERNGEMVSREKTDRTSKVTMIWNDDLQIVDLEWK